MLALGAYVAHVVYIMDFIIVDVIPYELFMKCFYPTTESIEAHDNAMLQAALLPPTGPFTSSQMRLFRFQYVLMDYEPTFWFFNRLFYNSPYHTFLFLKDIAEVANMSLLLKIFDYPLSLHLRFVNITLEYGRVNPATILPPLFKLWFQIMGLAIITIWARGVGPRFRPDQLSSHAWKDIVIFLVGTLICAIIIMAL